MTSGKILRLSLVLLMALSAEIVFSKSFFYVMESEDGSVRWTQWEISERDDSVRMIQRDHDGIKEFICDTDGSVRTMSVTDHEDRLFFLGQRKEDSIVLSGNGQERFETEMKNRYWYQPIGPSMFQFILSDEKEREFFIINPENNKSVSMTIGKTGRELLAIDGREMEAVKAELRLSGILSPFWSGQYWFSAETGILLKYMGDSGPGTSHMTMELVSSAQKIALIKGGEL